MHLIIVRVIVYFYFNCIKINAMKNERNKSLKVVYSFKCRFHKCLKSNTQRLRCTVKMCKYLFEI